MTHPLLAFGSPSTTASDRRTGRVIATAALCILSAIALFAVPLATPGTSQATPRNASRPLTTAAEARHFILLLDDSGDSPLRPRAYRSPARDVAAALFRRIDDGPGFQPSRDIVTVAFFQIPRRHYGRCFASRPLNSLTPEGMFDIVVPDESSLLSESAFAAYLQNQLLAPCRFPSDCYSPIDRALPLVIAAAHRNGQSNERQFVSRLYILRADNGLVNPLGDAEIEKLEHRAEGQKLFNEVANLFAFVELDRTRGSDPAIVITRFRADAKLYPASRPDAAMELSFSVILRRVAIGEGRIRLEAPGQGIIRIAPVGRLFPTEVVLTTEAAGNPIGVWQLGDQELPREVRVSLNPCQAPSCRQASNAYLIDAMAAVFPQKTIAAGSPAIHAGVIRARTRFSYGEPGIYKGLLVDGPRTLIDVIPESAAVITSSFVHPWRTVIDNPTLAAQYRGSDRDGVSQAVAIERIVAWRRYRLATLLILVIVGALFSVYRRFSPEPVVNAKVLVLDFNSARISQHAEAATVEIRNAATALFKPLQWKRRGPWTLTVDRLRAEWSTGRPAEGLQIGSLLRLQGVRDRTFGESLRGNGEDRAVLLLHQRGLEAISPPEGWDGAALELVITGDLTLVSEHATRSTPLSLAVRLEPEQARQPAIHLHEIRDEVKWIADSDLSAGWLVLESRARHLLATPAAFSYSFSITHNGATLYEGPDNTLSVPSSTELREAIIVPRGKTHNPITASEPWILTIIHDTTMIAQRTITVHRDVSAIEPCVRVNVPQADSAILIWNENGPVIQINDRQIVADRGRLRLPESTLPVSVGSDGTLRVCDLQISHAVPGLGGKFSMSASATLLVGGNSVPVPLSIDGRPWKADESVVVEAGDTPSIVGDLREEPLFSLIQLGGVTEKAAVLSVTLGSTVPTAGPPARLMAIVEAPLLLRRREEGAILALDFGNSAIAIATLVSEGQLGSAQVHLTNCQDTIIRGKNWTLGTLDPENAEKGSALLPSAFAIEFDKRAGTLDGKVGTHWSPPPSPFSGRDPRMLSLPALSPHYSEFPERVVLSIKHMLGSDFTKMDLLDSLSSDQGPIDSLEVDEVLIAVLSAVARTYASGGNFERVVYTVPNTFADWQLERAERAIRAAFPKAIHEWTFPLRESDAVMYHYLDEHPAESSDSVVLFYDFGSGTIDLTLAKINSQDSRNEVTILARIGLDRAGAYLDGLLARCIDREIEKATIDDPGSYRYRLVGSVAVHDTDRRVALAEFRQRLSAAKRSWIAGESLKIRQEVEQRAVVRPGTAVWASIVNAGLGTADEPSVLSIGWDTVQADVAIDAFLKFIRVDLIHECLALGGIRNSDLNKIIISGRGALWPGFVDDLADGFRSATVSTVMENDPAAMKLAVVSGALAWIRNRHRLVISQEKMSPTTYVAFTGLNAERGRWSRLQILGTDFREIGEGPLDVARIDFRVDPKGLSSRLQHPLWNRLIRPYPSKRQCSARTEAKIERSPNGRDVIVLRDGRQEARVALEDKTWSVGEWSVSSMFGD
jgi:hypothetical protein